MTRLMLMTGLLWLAAAAAEANTTFKCTHAQDVDWTISLSPTTNYGVKNVDLRNTKLQGTNTYFPAAPYSLAAKTYNVILDFVDPQLTNVCDIRGAAIPDEVPLKVSVVQHYGRDVIQQGDKYPKRGRAVVTANGITKQSRGAITFSGGTFDKSGTSRFGSVAVGGSFDLSAVISIYGCSDAPCEIIQDLTMNPGLAGSRLSGTLRYFTLEAVDPPIGGAPLPPSALLGATGMLSLLGMRRKARRRAA